MLVITNYQKGTASAAAKRSSTNRPEERQEKIYSVLVDQYNVLVPDQTLTSEKIVQLGVHTADYLDFLENVYASFQETPDNDYMKSDGLVPYHFSRRLNFQTWRSLSLFKQMGYYCDDVITPINQDTYRHAMESANNTYTAARLILDGTRQHVYCLNSSPGHHAMRSGYGGYCFLNNALIAATELARHGQRVAILDVDYHAGNGMADILQHLPLKLSILAISIHADPKYEYPSYSGFVDEIGPSNNHNYVFEKNAKWPSYRDHCLLPALGQIKKFLPDVIVVAFGSDTYARDPDASILYGCGLEVDDYLEMGRLISMACSKIIICQEGGYSEAVPQITDNFLKGIGGRSRGT